MTKRDNPMRVYRSLTALYPKTFRSEYRHDLVALLEEQLQDEPPLRVWARTLRDLAVTIPTQHLEVRMHRPSGRALTVASAIVALTAALAGIVVGSPVPILLLLLVAAGAATLAIWSWRANRPLKVGNPAARAWWKFLLAGVLLAAITFSAIAFPWPNAIDLGDAAYWLAVGGVLTSVVLGMVGVVLGISALVIRGRNVSLGAPAA
jgi:hypothetical protein